MKQPGFTRLSSRSSRRHAVAPRWGRRPQRHSGGGGPALKADTRVAASTTPPKYLDIFQGAPLRLPKPLSDQFPVRVCSCPLCIINRLWKETDGTVSRLIIIHASQREQAPRSRQPCSSCRRRGGRLRCARFVSATNGYETVADTRIAVTLVDLVMM